MASKFQTYRFGASLLVFEVFFIVFIAIWTEYHIDLDARRFSNASGERTKKDVLDWQEVGMRDYYSMFQDIAVMIFVGFGFLMTFLKVYGFGAVGLNLLLSAFVIQWSMICYSWFQMVDGKGQVTINTLVLMTIACAPVLISYGAVLGKANPMQLLIMAFIEVPLFVLNEHILNHFVYSIDVGGSMIVHAFGAYFGISAARMIYKTTMHDNAKESSVYHSDLFAMIGTCFLWIYWPSFNAALVNAGTDERPRCIVHTYLALSASSVCAFALSSLLNHGKLDMVHVQNATLAGGVAVGASAHLMLGVAGATAVGALAGSISVLGYKFLTPFLNSHTFHDTCGVNNLHGMPGIFAAIVSVVMAGLASEKIYGKGLYNIYPARAPKGGNATYFIGMRDLGGPYHGQGRSAGAQAGMQFAALMCTLGIAIVGGIVTGAIMRVVNDAEPEELYDDRIAWETPEEGFEAVDNGDARGHPEDGVDKMQLSATGEHA